MASWTFTPIRQSLMAKGHTQAAIDNLELALLALQAEIDALPTPDEGDEFATQAWVEALVEQAAQKVLAQAHLLDMVPFTRDEIIAIVDNTILTEDGDDLLTEGGDALLMESA